MSCRACSRPGLGRTRRFLSARPFLPPTGLFSRGPIPEQLQRDFCDRCAASGGRRKAASTECVLPGALSGARSLRTARPLGRASLHGFALELAGDRPGLDGVDLALLAEPELAATAHK